MTRYYAEVAVNVVGNSEDPKPGMLETLIVDAVKSLLRDAQIGGEIEVTEGLYAPLAHVDGVAVLRVTRLA